MATFSLILWAEKKQFRINTKRCGIPFLLLIGIAVELSEKIWVVGNKSFAQFGLGKRFLNHNWRFTGLFVKAAFPMYLFHQTVIVVLAYWIISDRNVSVYVQYLVIMLAAFGISYGLYLLTGKSRVCRWLFGIKA